MVKAASAATFGFGLLWPDAAFQQNSLFQPRQLEHGIVRGARCDFGNGGYVMAGVSQLANDAKIATLVGQK